MFYCLRKGWFIFFDHLNSTDTSSVLQYYYGCTELYDVRHPLFTLIGFPIYSLGFAIHWKERIYQISFAWMIYAWILFVPLNWSVIETPLFNLYFSWAILVLFIGGMDWIIQKLRFNRDFVYIIASGVLLIVGVIENMTIMMFLCE